MRPVSLHTIQSLMIFSSGAALAYLDEPVDYTAEEDIIRFLQVYYTILVKEDSILLLPE